MVEQVLAFLEKCSAAQFNCDAANMFQIFALNNSQPK